MRKNSFRLAIFAVVFLFWMIFTFYKKIRLIENHSSASFVQPSWAYSSLNKQMKTTSSYAMKDKESDSQLSNRFELYVRLTSRDSFKEQLDNFLFKSMNMFFSKHLASTVVVLDSEKSADLAFGNQILKQYAHMRLRLCFMNPAPNGTIHHWGMERMYLDMMHADFCTKREFVGFLDADTLFVTAITEDLLFENEKPVVTGIIGMPRRPCWLLTAEYILGHKQVMQCMSYFPIVFKVTHIINMRKHVEQLHKKSFLEVFKIAPKAVYTATTCFCHYSIMCNYVWYHHRDSYAWHLQLEPNGTWNGDGAIQSMVNASYFENEVLAKEKLPIPRSSVHARHLMYEGKYQDGFIPPKAVTDRLMKEGLCYSFGFDKTQIQKSLFTFEIYQWQWDPRCYEMQVRHYSKVHELVKLHPKQFCLDVTSSSSICSLLGKLSLSQGG